MDKKAISPVVSAVLLITVAVVAIVTFQLFYDNFSSSVFSDVEVGSGTLGANSVETIVDDSLYIKTGEDNLTIIRVELDGNDCDAAGVYGTGVVEINISSCLANITSEIADVVIVTSEGVFSETLFLPNIASGGSSASLDCTTLNGGEWIEVPGNPTLGTSDFCVMKYEAKATTASEANLFDSANMYCGDGGGNNCPTDFSVNVTSKAASKSLTNVYQTEARQLCANLGANYHLITDAQWVTIARDAENVAANWADGVIGSTVASGGGLKRGNVGIVDSASYDGPGPEFGTGRNTLARLNLSNGESIWDLSGNVWEWTNDTFNNNSASSLNQSSQGYYEWTDITGYDYLEPADSSLNSTNGVGRWCRCWCVCSVLAPCSFGLEPWHRVSLLLFTMNIAPMMVTLEFWQSGIVEMW